MEASPDRECSDAAIVRMRIGFDKRFTATCQQRALEAGRWGRAVTGRQQLIGTNLEFRGQERDASDTNWTAERCPIFSTVGMPDLKKSPRLVAGFGHRPRAGKQPQKMR